MVYPGVLPFLNGELIMTYFQTNDWLLDLATSKS